MNGRGVEQLLLELKARDIHLRIVDDQLRVSAPEAGLPAELSDELKACKQEILDILKTAQQDGDSSISQIVASNDVSSAPLSFGQQRSWFVHELSKELASPYDTLTLGLRIRGELNVDALEQSLIEILRRHEVLRTVFVLKDDEPRQMVEAASLDFEQEDISQLPPAERECRLREILQADKNTLFDLATGPLLKTRLIRLGNTEHVLNIIVHHIAFDNWSGGILMRELKLLYENFAEGRPSPLPELPIQYRDFSIWQRNWLQGEELQKHLGYWIDQLAYLPILDLQTDRPRPALQTFNGASEKMLLSRELSAALRTLSKQHRVTLHMTMLTTLGILLHRYSGQDDFGIGTPIVNRDRNEVQDLIGFFLNMLVMRLDLSGEPTFTGLLERVKHTALTGYAHQHLPFEKLVEEMELDRETSRTPLFQISFNMLDKPDTGPLQLNNNLEFSSISTIGNTTRFDLEVYVREGSAGLALSIVYNTDLFDASTIRRMLEHYRNLLHSVVADPIRRIAELTILSAEEEHQLLRLWNQTKTDYQLDVTLQQLFETQVDKTPKAIAVEFGDQSLSYAGLDERANRIAHYLQENGVGPGKLVGVYMERSLEMVVALYGILKSGGAYVPLDPEYPSERIAFMAEETQVPVLLTQEHLREQLPPSNSRVLYVDTHWDVIAGKSGTRIAAASTAEDLAYVIYTSGSTGKPKGVMNGHRGIVNRLLWMQEAYALKQEDRVLQKTPFSFDVSVWEFFWPLITGARLVMAVPGGHKDSAYLSRVIREREITTLHFVPSMLKAFLDNSDAADFVEVKRVICSGEALPHELQQQFFKLHNAELHNLYGPTEAAVDVSYWACRRDDERRVVPIGRPVANTQLYVLDPQLQPLPIGVSGELYIGGVQVAKGYLGRPELTAEKFIPDPFSDQPGARLYKTGDLARFLPDGAIDYIGRIDNQIKLRGLRIELNEIEYELGNHEAVKDVVVVAREEKPGDKRLVAYVTAACPEEPSVADLRAHLRRKLPEYMVPASFMVLDRFPLSANGKLDRRALPAPQGERQSSEKFVEPGTDLERQLVEIWREVLGVTQIGIHDNFFDLGGHSLMATKVVSRIRRQLNVELPLSEVFAYPSVAVLAPVVESLLDESGEEVNVIPVADREGNLPLSFAQERLWFLDQLEPGGSAYNMPLALRLEGELSAGALEKSINAIVDRQRGLRTHFTVEQGKPYQVINEITIELAQDDLSALSREKLEDEVRARIDAEARQGFDLSSGPLLRCRLLRLSDREHVLLMTMHHVISDGWSLGVLFRELGACYEAFKQGEQPVLTELPIQYADFAVWHRGWLSGEVLTSQLDYWRENLEDMSTLNLPTDRPRPALQTYTGSSEKLVLDAELSNRLNSLSRREEVTLFMTMLAGFAVLLHRYSGQDDIVVGTPIANRNRAELENLIGCFVNSLVMRTDVSGNPNYTELMQRVNRNALEAYEHQDLPFEKLVDEIQPDRDLSHNPLFQVMFTLQNAPIRSLELEGLTLESIRPQVRVSAFDLECHVWEKADGLAITFVYNTDLFDASTIRRMMTHYRRLLEASVTAPETPVGELEILEDEEKQLMLGQWNQTRADYIADETLHSLFQQQARRTPRATALRFEQESLDYAGLEQRTKELASLLLAKNIEPGQFVGIFLERSIDLVVAVLGILKAGAAYVPLDPEYPEEHLNYIVADSHIRVLLSQKRFEDRLPSCPGDVIYLDNGKNFENIETRALPAVTQDMLAYVIYTSGTTGKPKGVMVSHGAVVNHAFWMRDLFGIDESDRLLQKSPISFDASVCEIFVPLLNGACVVMAVPGGDRDINYLIQEIQNNKITTLILVPSALRILLQNLTDPAALGTLKRMGCGGEALTLDLLQAYYEKCSAPLYNLYGPTESTIDATSFLCEANFNHDSIPIGTPVSNIQVYILDPQMQPVPIGVHGELHIGGAGLARGYHNQPALTAEKFITDPFSDDPEARLYKTGDLARYRADGNIEYSGRIDHQVKLRGFRIELGEIESALASHTGVRESAVMVREDRPGDKRLVAYVVAEGDVHPATSVANLRDFVRQKLPDYMVPSAFMILDRLPLSASGKLDRRALPMPDDERQSGEAFVEPRSDLERQLVEIWREVLGVAQVGIHDNFFDLGGHSLKLIELHNRLAHVIEVSLSLVDLFAHPTVSSLVEYIVKPEISGNARFEENDRVTNMAAGSQRLKQLRQKRQRNMGIKV